MAPAAKVMLAGTAVREASEEQGAHLWLKMVVTPKGPARMRRDRSPRSRRRRIASIQTPANENDNLETEKHAAAWEGEGEKGKLFAEATDLAAREARAKIAAAPAKSQMDMYARKLEDAMADAIATK